MAFLNATVVSLDVSGSVAYFLAPQKSVVENNQISLPSNPTWHPFEISFPLVQYLTRNGNLRDQVDGKIAMLQVDSVQSYYICHYLAYFKNGIVVNHNEAWEPILISESTANSLERDESYWIKHLTMTSLNSVHIGETYLGAIASSDSWGRSTSIRAALAYDINIGRLPRN